MTLCVLPQLHERLELLAAGFAGVHLNARKLLPVLLHVQRELALEDELIAALRADEVLQTAEHSETITSQVWR